MGISKRALASFVVLVMSTHCSPATPPSNAPILPPVEVAVAPPPPPPPVVPESPHETPYSVPPSAMENALADWQRKSQCQDFDYYPNGGIQNFWCHRPAGMTVATVRAFIGVDIFKSGPHGGGVLKLDEANDFGHYDPAFVRALIEMAGPSEHGSPAQRATQPMYDASMKPLAEIFWKTYSKAQADKECFAREKTAYANLIAKKKLPKDYYERWFYFMNPHFCEKGPEKSFKFWMDNGFDGGVDGNVTKTVVGFWLRRSLDGTMDAFATGLMKLILAYEPQLLTNRTF